MPSTTAGVAVTLPSVVTVQSGLSSAIRDESRTCSSSAFRVLWISRPEHGQSAATASIARSESALAQRTAAAMMARLAGLLFRSDFGSLIQHLPSLTESRRRLSQAKQEI